MSDENFDREPTDEPTVFDRARRAVADGADPEAAAVSVVEAMTDEELLWCLDGDAPMWAGLELLTKGGYHDAPFAAARIPRLGVPGIAFSDGPRGVVIGNATCFPVSMARGATWDPELEERVGEAIGRELRASGATLFGGVCVNLLRHPAWGRAQETYGEDPHHVGEMGAALTRGVQRHAMATVKHFAANSIENSRFRVDVTVDDVALHEVFLPHFRRIVDEGIACVMSAYNQVNGTYCGEHGELLTDVLRGEWGFSGFVISDWIYGLRDAATSVRAGLDIEMPYRMVRSMNLERAIDDGSVSWGDVRRSAERIVATLLRFDSILSAPKPSAEIIGSSEHVALARSVAGQSIVLLRNEHVGSSPLLPLDVHAQQTIAVVGRLSDRVNLGDGGSSDVYSLDNVTIREGIEHAASQSTVVHLDGDDREAAVRGAREADVVVVVVGYTAEDEGEFIGDPGVDLRHLLPPADDVDLAEKFRNEERRRAVRPDHVRHRPGLGFSVGGDRASLRLRAEDESLIESITAVNPRTVVVVQAGSAVTMTPWIDQVPAVLQAWYGGQQAGHGLADVLFGVVNPAGRLPFTIPVDASHLPDFDREADRAVYDRWHGWWRGENLGHEPLFPFGFGLSYTHFRIDDVTTIRTDDGHQISCRVTNAGTRDGADVIQVYARFTDPSTPRRLVGFRRVHLEAGESMRVEIDVAARRLEQRDSARRSWIPPSGEVHFSITDLGVGLDEIAAGSVS
jgi:beta-glucosidase